ncbi:MULTISPECIES: carbohydrate ABC transporter permease [unclassified Paenibacillus]|uniref:carbohydrate ABC transporter permease n=1 Tax=unclassified Paenibacillus TaxID=185978 RepID=UPI0024049150|nr:MULTISPECIES: carbohydrate ABC transporter permease [unclassified Paenibacillus]MDF9840589.1 multiple sugar transport system permease protein [Paenibacillus sp. PastF-2]MDF9847171.1 multiple sugar transport system permease protein [Paenibacillus sp. PastM-2]MDF9853743.1 multiple sugar transport system permease protein [Paenibacillus sp. PastF-1]MDH6478771.1 multiple sugar transport system permease protein [Paenibacillus sp. PastH-2]MDH6506503.1 multiple sugar transport system permease prote
MTNQNPRPLPLTLFMWGLALIVAFLILFPLWWIFISSITPSGELFSSPIKYWPDHPTLASYRYLIENVGLLPKIWDTAIIVGLSILIGMVVSVMAAFSFARFRTRGLALAIGFLLASMLIPDVVTARPLYDFMRSVHLYDTYTGLIILYISGILPFTILILQNYLNDVPVSIEESAAIDGCGFFQSLIYVTVPLLRPALATVCIVNFITCLNNFFTPLFYSNGISVLSTAITQLPLRDNMYAVPWDLVSAMGWIIILPIILFVAIFQRQIMEGIMAGGVKG